MDKLNKRHVFNVIKSLFAGFDGPLALIVFLLLGTGLATLYSAAIDIPGRVEDRARSILLPFVLIWIIVNLPQQILMHFTVPLYTVGVALLIGMAAFRLIRKGARRWLNIGVVVQPSGIMKIAMPLMLAWHFQKRGGVIHRYDYLAAALLLLIPVGLIVKQPDLGTALLVLATGICMIYFAGLSWRLVVLVLVIVVTAVTPVVSFESRICAPDVNWPVLRDYQQHRVCTLLDPTTDPFNKGFHTTQSIITIDSSGVTDKGQLKGTRTHLRFIPEKHTDLISAVYSEGFGLVGNGVLLLLYLLLVLRRLFIAANADTLFGCLLVGSITLIFFTYIFISVGVVSGVLPVVGVPLLLISYGGTTLITLDMGIGILMSIVRQKRFVQT